MNIKEIIVDTNKELIKSKQRLLLMEERKKVELLNKKKWSKYFDRKW